MTDKIREALVQLYGLVIHYDEDWVGEPPNRRPVKNDRVKGVTLPLTPEEWCSLCMRTGENYIGGCCGRTSATQDILNHVFREGGWADAHTIRELMDVIGQHEGFEQFGKYSEAELEKDLEAWSELGPIEKIGVCCQAVKPKLATDRRDQFHLKPKSDYVRELEESLRLFSFRDMFQDDGDKSGQRHANQEVLLARAVPAAKKFLAATVPLLDKPFRGVAIVKKGTDQIQTNGRGLCIYKSEDDAQEVINLWRQARNEAREDERAERDEHLAQIEVKRVEISAEKGVVLK